MKNMDFEKKSDASFADIISFVSENKQQNDNNWKSKIKSQIEADIDNQVKQALDVPQAEKKWMERKKANRHKKLRNLQIMKLNSLHHARPPVFGRNSDESSSERSFKYIDVNYVPGQKAGSLPGHGNQKLEKIVSFNRRMTGYDFTKPNGIMRMNGSLAADYHSRNMRGGLDVTLLDTHTSSVNFLSLPKHDIATNLRPIAPGVGVGMITFNGVSLPNYGQNRRCFQTYSKEGLSNVLNSRSRRNKLNHIGHGKYVDKRGIVLSKHGPFWPQGYGPVCQCPRLSEDCPRKERFGPSFDLSLKREVTNELMSDHNKPVGKMLDPHWKPATHRPQVYNAKSTMTNSFYNNGGHSNSGHHGTHGSYDSSIHHHSNGSGNHGNGIHNNRMATHHRSNIQNVGNAQQQSSNTQWRGKPVIFDSERASRTPLPHAVPEGFSESLVFESRFESGNLRQVRRIGEYEYEFVLRTDMYTKRHTQWYYFRLQKAQRNVIYKFNIINLLKKDSLYNYGMKPLVYSEILAKDQNLGWHRMGENIRYFPWTNPTRNALLSLDLQYYNLEFEISFDWEDVEDDTLYLAHCYPYTYTDLKSHLDSIMHKPEQSRHVKREVLCETTAGNACFLLTITDFPDKEKDKYKDLHQGKKGVVVTARVHPGETQASWMMKGIIDFLVSDHEKAMELRKQFIFKIVPMLNPDGVIVGNYRTSLAARDLNRNYRHPRQTTFPTVWHTKQMIDQFSKDHEIILYCDLHGHSRKPMVFMYGCERKALYNGSGKQNGSEEITNRSPRDCARDFIEERLFPWLLHKRSPERFSFHGSKYAVRKCKEATGRVVMFRRFGIANSFTLEASFSGTMQKKNDSGRHFNIDDFLSVGRALCESVYEYSQISNNSLLKSRVIMDITKDLAQHVLESNPVMSQKANIGASSSSFVQTKSVDSAKIESKPIIVTKTSISPGKISVTKEIEKRDRGEAQNDAVQKDSTPVALNKPFHTSTTETKISIPSPPHVGCTEDDHLLDVPGADDEESSSLDENCYLMLEQLNFQQIAAESSTSSDSDSESDPELPADAPPPIRQKKKKRRKKRPNYMKSISAPSSLNSRKIDANRQDDRPKAFPAFINRYTHRSNGGIPIYAQERIQERAARRLAELKLAEEEKRRKQAEMFGDENGLKEEDRSKFAEVYGIHYQLGPQPVKPQYTIYNPFRSSTPPNGYRNDSLKTSGTEQQQQHQHVPFRIKNEGPVTKQPLVVRTHQFLDWSSSGSSDGDRENVFKTTVADNTYDTTEELDQTKNKVGSSGESVVTEKGDQAQRMKGKVPLQTCNLSFKINDHRGNTTKYHWMTAEEERVMVPKDLHWVTSNPERTKNNEMILTANKTDKKMKTGKNMANEDNNDRDDDSRVSTASSLPPSDPFTPRNLTQYDVIIGQMRYPIHVHRKKFDTFGIPMITGESILNQKPVDAKAGANSQARSAHRPSSSAECNGGSLKSAGSAGSIEQDHCFTRTRSLMSTDEVRTGSNDSTKNRFEITFKNDLETTNLNARTNGLVFAVHKVNMSSPGNKISSDDLAKVMSPLRNTPLPPKRHPTAFSHIVKPFTANSNSRQRSELISNPEFNINSAR